MSSKGIMRRARHQILVLALAFIVPAVFAQAPPAGPRTDNRDDLDVTMRVIVDPDAKVPDEIVRRIPLPKPGQPQSPPGKATDEPKETGKPAEPGAQGQQRALEARELGREFGQEVAEQARQRSEEVRRNNPPPGPAGPPPNPPPPTPRPPR